MLLENEFNFRYKDRDILFKAKRININMFRITWDNRETRYFENMIKEAFKTGIWIKV